MKEKMQAYIEKFKKYWQEKTTKQKGIFIGSVLIFIIFIVTLIYFVTYTPMVPLYSDLTPKKQGALRKHWMPGESRLKSPMRGRRF